MRFYITGKYSKLCATKDVITDKIMTICDEAVNWSFILLNHNLSVDNIKLDNFKLHHCDNGEISISCEIIIKDNEISKYIEKLTQQYPTPEIKDALLLACKNNKVIEFIMVYSIDDDDCPSCPFNCGNPKSDYAYNLGCLPSVAEIMKIKETTNKNWSCHSDITKICKGYVQFCKNNGIDYKSGELTGNEYL